MNADPQQWFISLVAGCHSFCLFFIFHNIHTFIHSITVTFIQYIYPSLFAEASLPCGSEFLIVTQEAFASAAPRAEHPHPVRRSSDESGGGDRQGRTGAGPRHSRHTSPPPTQGIPSPSSPPPPPGFTRPLADINILA
jgi:hypothetical protein